MSKKAKLVGLVLLFGIVLAACAPAAVPASAPGPAPSQAPAAAPAGGPAPPAAPAPAAWQVEWDKVVVAGKQEGRVAIANTGGRQVAAALTSGFKQAYGMALEVISGKGGELSSKILAERRAGLYNFDLYMGGSTTPLVILKPTGAFVPLDSSFILPDVTDAAVIKKTWLDGKIPWIDKDHTIIAGLAYPNPPIAINTNLVKPDEIKSYNDLLDPKWKGKMLMNDPTLEGAGSVFTLVTFNVLGKDFLAKLAKQEPQILRDQRLQLEWLAHGKVPVLIAPKPDLYFEFKSMGTPMMVITPTEGGWLTCTPAATATLKNPPHPNAGKLFLNWLLTKEGQTVLSQGTGGQSGRLDVATDFLPAEGIRQQGVKYWPKDSEEWLLMGPQMNALGKELFGPLMK